jgi:hypothetical protein
MHEKRKFFIFKLLVVLNVPGRKVKSCDIKSFLIKVYCMPAFTAGNIQDPSPARWIKKMNQVAEE